MKLLIGEEPHTNINLRDTEGNTPLILAVYKGLNEVIELLLECKADTNLRNKKGETALLLAIKEGVETTWETLLRNSKHLNVNEGGGVFPTALHMAADRGELKAVQRFLEYDADVNA